jgi:hypothetical protein
MSSISQNQKNHLTPLEHIENMIWKSDVPFDKKLDNYSSLYQLPNTDSAIEHIVGCMLDYALGTSLTVNLDKDIDAAAKFTYKTRFLLLLADAYSDKRTFSGFIDNAIQRCNGYDFISGKGDMMSLNLKKEVAFFSYLTGADVDSVVVRDRVESGVYIATDLTFLMRLIAIKNAANDSLIVKYLNSGRAIYEKTYVLNVIGKTFSDIMRLKGVTPKKRSDILKSLA